MTQVACLPPSLRNHAGTELRIDLFGDVPRAGRGRVGALIPPNLRRLRMAPSRRAWDFASVALSIVAADEAVARDDSPDGWTRQIALTVAVNDQQFWETQADTLASALCFLTGDIWTVTFVGGGAHPARPPFSRRRLEDSVCLLSGGMDSLIGAINAVVSGRSPALVSQIAKGDAADQRLFASTIKSTLLHVQLNHNARPPGLSERSQRARSIIFLAYGVLTATCLQSHDDGAEIDLLVPENGFISQNVPLTPLRSGSLSTRTTHPHFLSLVQSVLDAADLRVRIVNPYVHKTKGEMLEECLDQDLLSDLVGMSTSCGRFARTGFQHCGRCVPCQVRRAAYIKWGQADDTLKGYKYADLGRNDNQHRRFDDVRSVAMAIRTVERRGFDAWAGGAVSSRLLGDPRPYREVVERGLAELEVLLRRERAL
jgi:hypothetical protein